MAPTLPGAEHAEQRNEYGHLVRQVQPVEDGHGDVVHTVRHCHRSELSQVVPSRRRSLAGLGRLDEYQRALDEAEQVNRLTGRVHTGGWLRFDGSRLPEERGACYVELKRPDLAEVALTQALSQDLSPRRRGSVLIDLAKMGLQRCDPECLVMYADAALDTAWQTRSGVICRKLQDLQVRLAPFLGDRHVRHLNEQITTLATGFPPANN